MGQVYNRNNCVVIEAMDTQQSTWLGYSYIL
jgi:hypothetical protein